MMRDIILIALGIAMGIVLTLWAIHPAHARPLVAVNSPWAYSGCSGAALGRRQVVWTCRIED